MRYILLNKPYEVLTQFTDEHGRATLKDFVSVPEVYPVGRLDFDSEGLLLLTTDGAAAHRLTHPSRKLERTYVASVIGDAEGATEQAHHGVELEDGVVRPKKFKAQKLGRLRWELTITIAEGKNREVRRFCEALGLEVDRLVRVKFGPVELGDLPVGKVRSLTKIEVKALAKL